MRVPAAIALATVLGLATTAIASSIDEQYQATASGQIEPLTPLAEVDRFRAVAGLPPIEDDPRTPFLPGGEAALARIVATSARNLGLAAPPDLDEVTVIDTESELVLPKYKEATRRLKIKVRDEDPGRAARLADEILDSYVRERERAVLDGLRRARARLAQGDLPRPASQALRAEAVEAVDIALRLGGGVVIEPRQAARPPAEPILPHVARDGLVAALIGALLGCLAGGWRRRSHSRAELAARPS